MGKRNITSILLLGIVIGIFIATIFWGASNGLSNNWINLMSAIGTVGAVIFAVYTRTDKAKIILSATFTTTYLYDYEIVGWEKSEPERYKPVYSGKTTDVLVDELVDLKIYISNIRQSAGLITAWGVIDSSGEKCILSIEPVLVSGFDVKQILKHKEFDLTEDYLISNLQKIIENMETFQLYFENQWGKTQYCTVKKQETSNQSN